MKRNRIMSRILMFLRGMSSVLDISGKVIHTEQKEDIMDAIGEDFANVGRDIHYVIVRYSIPELKHEKAQYEYHQAIQAGQMPMELADCNE